MRKLKNYKPTKFKAKDSYYDKEYADFAVAFVKSLCHPKGTWAGKRFELMDWQEQIIRDLFGILKPNGYRQFNTAYIEIPKKNGKSELAAAVALLLTCVYGANDTGDWTSPKVWKKCNPSWQNGRQLASLQTADNSVSYKYDRGGMRTQKTDNGDTTYYYYDSNKNLIALTKGNYTLLFYYDSDGNVTSFKYNGTMYYYIKNLQGDVTKIVDEKGKVKVEYTYDAWGNILKEKSNVNPSYATVKEFNPFRYRGYVYDTDTGLYYLQSRYYDPKTGRFINADFVIETNTLNNNIFAFCRNNSVNRVDKTGTASRKLKYPGEIHAQIQKDICNIHRNFQKELSFKKSNGKNGRVDLLEAKRKVAYIWEIKPVSTPYSRAKKQIDSKGRTFSYKGYYVKYYYDKHGIIRYNYYEKADKKESSSSKSPYVYLAIGMSVIIVIGCIALAPGTGGASLGGLAFA